MNPRLLTLLFTLLCGCTVQRIEHDTERTLEWMRLTSRTDMTSATRWQLPLQTHIEVRETGAAPNADWLAAAQSGVDAVFPAGPASAADALTLLVTWPEPQRDRLLVPDFQKILPLRVALLRDADGAVVESARLDVTPHWFTARGSSPELVRQAFSDFAEQLRTAY